MEIGQTDYVNLVVLVIGTLAKAICNEIPVDVGVSWRHEETNFFLSIVFAGPIGWLFD